MMLEVQVIWTSSWPLTPSPSARSWLPCRGKDFIASLTPSGYSRLLICSPQGSSRVRAGPQSLRVLSAFINDANHFAKLPPPLRELSWKKSSAFATPIYWRTRAPLNIFLPTSCQSGLENWLKQAPFDENQDAFGYNGFLLGCFSPLIIPITPTFQVF